MPNKFLDDICKFLHKRSIELQIEAKTAGENRVEIQSLACNYDAAATVIKQHDEEVSLQAVLHYVNRYGKQP